VSSCDFVFTPLVPHQVHRVVVVVFFLLAQALLQTSDLKLELLSSALTFPCLLVELAKVDLLLILILLLFNFSCFYLVCEDLVLTAQYKFLAHSFESLLLDLIVSLVSIFAHLGVFLLEQVHVHVAGLIVVE